MNKARVIALCGVCGAMSCVALLLASLVPYIALICGVIASIATVAPLIVDGKNLGYSLLTYAATLTIGAVSGIFLGNIIAVAPVALFCVPFAIVKVWGESYKSGGTVERSLDAPFEGEEKVTLTLPRRGKRRLNVIVKWVLYYVLLEAGIALTLVFSWLMSEGFVENLYGNKTMFWLIVGVGQLAVPLYDILLRGCLIVAEKVIRKVIK